MTPIDVHHEFGTMNSAPRIRHDGFGWIYSVTSRWLSEIMTRLI